MDCIDPLPNKTDPNLSQEERTALKELMENDDIIIKPADKGGCLVIMNKSFYRDKMVIQDHLNSDTYEKSDVASDSHAMQELEGLMEIHKDYLTSKEREFICDFEWQTSEF